MWSAWLSFLASPLFTFAAVFVCFALLAFDGFFFASFFFLILVSSFSPGLFFLGAASAAGLVQFL